MRCAEGCGRTSAAPIPSGPPQIKGTRFAIRRRAVNLRQSDRTILDELESRNHELYAGWLLIEQLRGVYLAHDYTDAIELLDDWILAALESGMEPFQRTALTLDCYRGEIANAITLGLTNARLEDMNSTVRLISHRARGFRRLESLLSMLMLICGRIPVELPT